MTLFRCLTCGRTFSTAEECVSHMNTAHPGPKPVTTVTTETDPPRAAPPRCSSVPCDHVKTAYGHCNVLMCPNVRQDCPVPGHMG